MEETRTLTSDRGLAVAQTMKKTGKTLEQVLQKNALTKYAKDFTLLSEAQQGDVYLYTIERAGAANKEVMVSAAKMGKYGKGLLWLTVALALYNVLTADEPAAAAAHEGASLMAGALGGAAGGAAAGMVCGPGAPVCVTVGIFVGGALGALGVELGFHMFASE
jgi:hypothetical protein